MPASVNAVADVVRDSYRRGKAHALIVVAEGVSGGGDRLASELAAKHADVGFDVRLTRIGHVQRGGAPGALNGILASRTGAAAIEALARGVDGVVIGIAAAAIRETPLDQVIGRIKPIDPSMVELARVLSAMSARATTHSMKQLVAQAMNRANNPPRVRVVWRDVSARLRTRPAQSRRPYLRREYGD